MIGVAPGSRTSPSVKWGHLLCYALIAVYSCFLWGSLIHATWGVIDDHEIMWMIGEHPRLPPSQLGQALVRTELAPEATVPRFRPSYYVLRATEAMVWGKQPGLWYGFRILIALLVGLSIAWLCLPFAGPLLTTSFTIVALSAPYWGDIFARAGPAESYVVLGLCVTALSWPLRRNAFNFLASTGVSMGIIIAAGSKENMLILAVIPIMLLLLRKRQRITPWACLPLIASLAFMAWIALTVMSRLHNTGTDIYSNDVSLHSRIELLLSVASRQIIWVWALAAISGLLAWWFMHILRTRSDSSADDISTLLASLKRFSIGGVVLLMIYLSQIVFYTKVWPDGELPGRYLFPGILAAHLQVLFGCVLLVDGIRVATRHVAYSNAITTCAAALLCMSLLNDSFGHLTENRKRVVDTLASTQQFSANLNRLKTMLREDPVRPLIVNVHSVLDNEPVVSLYRFLRADGIKNPFAIRTNALEPERFTNPFERVLAKRLQVMSDGSSGEIGATPISSTNPQDCYSVGLHGQPLSTCRAGFTFKGGPALSDRKSDFLSGAFE